MNGTKLESVQCVKDLGVRTGSIYNLKFSQQCKDAAGKANRMLDFINGNLSFKIRRSSTTVHHLIQTTSRVCCAVLGALPCKGGSEIRGCPAKGYDDDYVLE